MLKFLLAIFVVMGCKAARTGGDTKFITVAHDDPERFVNGENILIKKVHEESWDILYGFDEDCPANRKTVDNYRMLRESIAKGIRVWLAPLQKITKRPIVDKFVFLRTGDRDTRPDISAVFACVKGRSVASRKGVSIYMRETHYELTAAWITPVLPYFIGSFLHELGHTFDLADTYVGNPSFSPASTGDSIETIGRQPQSVMSIGTGCGVWALCLDDERAIQWLYRYHYEDLDPKSCPPEFEYEQLTHKGQTVGGCVFKQPLLVELRQKHLSKATQILSSDKKLKINDKDKHGYSALHYLAPLHLDFDRGDFRLFLKKFLEYPGIDVNITDNHDNTPLHWAAWFGNAIMVFDLLLRAGKSKIYERTGTEVNARNIHGITALHNVAKLGREESTKYLLMRSDIELNLKEHRAGNAPLHEAAKNGHTEIVKMLLAHERINRNIRNRGGKTARELAVLNGYKETVKAFD